MAPGRARRPVAADGTPSRRTVLHPLAVGEDAAASWYGARLPGAPRSCRVATVSLPFGALEVRVHALAAPEGVPAGTVWRDGGHALAGDDVPAAEASGGRALARRADGLTSAVAVLYGGGAGGVRRARDASAFGRHAAVPYVARELAPEDVAPAPGAPAGGPLWVTLVVLTGEPLDAAGLRQLCAGVRVSVAADGVRVAVPGHAERHVPHPFGAGDEAPAADSDAVEAATPATDPAVADAEAPAAAPDAADAEASAPHPDTANTADTADTEAPTPHPDAADADRPAPA